MAALLGQVGGRQIDHQPAGGQGKAQSCEGGPHPLTAFTDRLVAKSNQNKADLTAGQLDFDIDAAGLNPFKRDCDNLCDHDLLPPTYPQGHHGFRIRSRTKTELK